MMHLFDFVDTKYAPVKNKYNPVATKCGNRQLTAKAKLSALKEKGWAMESTSMGMVLKQPQGRAMQAFAVSSLVKECFGDKCDLVQPTENPLFEVSELGSGKFLVKFNKEIF